MTPSACPPSIDVKPKFVVTTRQARRGGGMSFVSNVILGACVCCVVCMCMWCVYHHTPHQCNSHRHYLTSRLVVANTQSALIVLATVTTTVTPRTAACRKASIRGPLAAQDHRRNDDVCFARIFF